MSFQEVLDSTILEASHDPTRLGDRDSDYAIVQHNLPTIQPSHSPSNWQVFSEPQEPVEQRLLKNLLLALPARDMNMAVKQKDDAGEAAVHIFPAQRGEPRCRCFHWCEGDNWHGGDHRWSQGHLSARASFSGSLHPHNHHFVTRNVNL
jgi:hypothetical protein